MKLKVLEVLLFAILTLNCQSARSQSVVDKEVERRAQTLLSQMTLDEKLSYIGGYNDFYIREIKRLGIPAIKMSDGPQGLRNDGKSNAMPCGIMLASTWNKDLATAYGKALGEDAKARGVHILLGPGVNIYRAPMCGRNFEYFGEDPYLTSRMAVGYIRGVQSEGVMATVKHFAANNQEWDRYNVSSDIDERTVQEIYLPAFAAAVKEAKVGAVMSSYNLLNGVYTSQNRWLLTDVLRKQWGFQGILMSDWIATHNTVEATNNGLDLEMPGALFMSADSIRYYIATGKIQEKTINEKVLRILRTIINFGFLDKAQLDGTIPLDNPKSAVTALNVAREGVVLLKNDNQILPITNNKIKKIVVCGLNASQFVSGGGSGRLNPFHFVSTLDGIRKIANQSGIQVSYLNQYSVLDKVLFVDKSATRQGLRAQYFNNIDFKGMPILERIDSTINFDWRKGTNISGMPRSQFSVRWSGIIRTSKQNLYNLALSGNGTFHILIDGKRVCDNISENGDVTKVAQLDMQADKDYSISVEYVHYDENAAIRLEWNVENALSKAFAEADLIVACFGFNSSTEMEGYDRTFKLPASENDLIHCAILSGKPIIGVVNAGGSVEMQQWFPKLGGLLWAWYPGQEGGTAIAEVLFGSVNPSGKLPVTFEKKWEDNPTFNSYYDTDKNKRVGYSEGIFVGYRGYDKQKAEVQFPFGYGLSYTKFKLSHMTVEKSGKSNSKVIVTCKLQNIGAVEGAEVVQLYIAKPVCEMPQPLKELKGFEKILLKSRETRTVTFEVSRQDLSFYNDKSQQFAVKKGKYNFMLGTSSRDIVLQKHLVLE